MSELISIIVPVYNVEKYLSRCVESILAQTYSNWELLLIDDGSTDKSGLIGDSFAERDERITIYHKQNGGVSSARNYGLDHSNGDYIAFIDSDDYVENEYLEVLLDAITRNNADISACGWRNEKGIKNISKIKLKKDSECIVNITKQMDGLFTIEPVWCYLYKKDIIGNIRFSEDIFYTEDILFTLEVIINTPGCKMALIKDALYFYDQSREDSAMNQEFNLKKLTLIKSCNKMVHISKGTGIYEIIVKARRYFFMTLFVHLIQSELYYDGKAKDIYYLKKELKMDRKKGLHPQNRRENIVEWMYLYINPIILRRVFFLRDRLKKVL